MVGRRGRLPAHYSTKAAPRRANAVGDLELRRGGCGGELIELVLDVIVKDAPASAFRARR